MPNGIGIKLVGTKQTERALNKLKNNVRRKVLVEALTKTARHGVSVAKVMLKQKRTGLLKKSLAFKSKAKGKDGGYRVVGADRGFKAQVPGSRYDTAGPGTKLRLSGKTKGGKIRSSKIGKKAVGITSGIALDPAKYAHLVEGGRKTNMAKNKKAMYFRVFGKGVKGVQVFAKRVKAVPPQEFMRPTAEKLKLVHPYNVAQALKKVWP